MQTFTSTIWSSVGRKFLNGVTGLLLSAFILVHLIENYLLFCGAETFNLYVHYLTSLGGILYIIEFLLAMIFLFHMISAVTVWIGGLRARPDSYKILKSAGGKSRQTISSKTMIYTGVLLLIFLIMHLKTLKFGPHYLATYDGLEVRDMHRLVMEIFTSGGYLLWYEAMMILLGFHLRHGFWSSFQSLGLSHPRYSPIIYVVGYLFAILVAIGFLAIPLWIYITGGVQ